MRTSREEFEPGQSRAEDFWKFVNERHAMWIRRCRGAADAQGPWTEDPILAGSKFTNIFRELDRGTIALRRLEERILPAKGGAAKLSDEAASLLLFNVMWYRMLNRAEHAEGGPLDSAGVRKLCMRADPLFTSAHQTYLPKDVGPGEGVRRWYADTFSALWRKRHSLLKEIRKAGTLEGSFGAVRGAVPGIGPFIAYEIVTDLRRTLLARAPDAMRWCNINRGGGSARGLRRLGIEESPAGAWKLLNEGINAGLLAPHVEQHLPTGMGTGAGNVLPLLELREVEHALCEFDKYERVRTGLGKVRGGRFRPRGFDDGGFAKGLKVREA